MADRDCACGCLAVRLARVCGLTLQPIGCTSALACDVQRYCSCSCRLWRDISVMHFTFFYIKPKVTAVYKVWPLVTIFFTRWQKIFLLWLLVCKMCIKIVCNMLFFSGTNCSSPIVPWLGSGQYIRSTDHNGLCTEVFVCLETNVFRLANDWQYFVCTVDWEPVHWVFRLSLMML